MTISHHGASHQSVHHIRIHHIIHATNKCIIFCSPTKKTHHTLTPRPLTPFLKAQPFNLLRRVSSGSSFAKTCAVFCSLQRIISARSSSLLRCSSARSAWSSWRVGAAIKISQKKHASKKKMLKGNTLLKEWWINVLSVFGGLLETKNHITMNGIKMDRKPTDLRDLDHGFWWRLSFYPP